MNPITIPNISISTIGIPTIGIPSVGFPSASGGGGLSWPAGMKEHIKAWYDPKKQGMTNFDVIEAYVEDFSKNPWNNKTEKYVGNLTSKALTVTEVLVRSALIYTNIKPYNFKVRITGLINNQKVIFGDDISAYRALIVDKDGIYDINWEDNHKAYCIWMDFIGECNITITQLPTSILKDFSGNGNHAYLYGGKGKLNSGMGVYQQDYTTYDGDIINSYTGRVTFNNRVFGIEYNRLTKDVEPYNVKITGINTEVVRFTYRGEEGLEKLFYIKNDGYYTLPKCYKEGTQGTSVSFTLDGDYNDNSVITITQIPDYPDQLCYDGKMYAVAYDMPILTDYTVMAERTILDNSDIADWAFIAKRDYPAINGAFTFEKDIDDASDNFRTISFGRTSVIYKPIKERSISYQTKNKYNGQDIIVGNVDDVDFLLIGAGILDTNLNLVKEKMRVAHGAIIIADRSFTEEEINWLKQNWDKI